MKVAFKKTTINPGLPIHMDGYNQRISYQINDNIELRTFIIQTEETLLVHVLDVLLITEELSHRFKKRLISQFNIKQTNIILAASHTHSGPKITKYLFPNVEPSEEYLSDIEKALVANTQYCIDNLRFSHAFFGKSHTESLYSNRNNKDASYNNQLMTIQFRDKENQSIFQIANLAVHPTVLKPEYDQLSSDLIGAFQNQYEERTNIPLVILNGDSGDVSTRHTRKGTDYVEVIRIGDILAKVLEEIKEYTPISLENMTITEVGYKYGFSPKEDEDLLNSKLALEEKLADVEVITENNSISDMLSKVENKLKQDEIIENYNAKIIETNDFRLVAFPGEIVTTLGEKLRDASDKVLFIAAYADDFKGYAIDEKLYGEIPETYLTDFPRGVADQFVNQIIESYS